MTRWKISARLALLIGLLCAGMGVIGAFGLYGMHDCAERLRSVYEGRTVALSKLLDVQRLLLQNRNLVSRAMAINDRQAIDSSARAITANMAVLDQSWAGYKKTRQTSEEEVSVREFEAAWLRFKDGFLQPALAALKTGQTEAAYQLLEEKEEALYAPMRANIIKLTDLQTTMARQEYGSAQAMFAVIRAGIVGLTAVGVAFGMVFGWLLVRGITRALSQAIAAADAVAGGDLSHPIAVRGKDEVAAMLEALRTMQAGLRAVVLTVRQGAQAVAASSVQIAQGNEDLSDRTESQAGVLQQTAASMEQLGATVRENAGQAQRASQLAESASSVAQQGGQVVAQVVETMRGISDASHRMADIIGVIDSIAFQTNILALNAAVEAARAGELGRGFAVVAGEVRSLAGRCASAAREIKALIDDSAARVGQGRELADRAGATTDEVVAAIGRVTAIMGEISSANRAQSAGVDQAGAAVMEMDRTTQRNAALVEEMAAAATGLRGQARELVQAVSVFRLDDGAQALALPLS